MCPGCEKTLSPGDAYVGVCPLCGRDWRHLRFMAQQTAHGTRVTGSISTWFGWILVLLGIASGTLAGLGNLLLFGGAHGSTLFGLIIALMMVLPGLSFAWLGWFLRRRAQSSLDAAREQAVLTLGQVRGGWFEPLAVTHSLGLTLDETDQLLTRMAKNPTTGLRSELDAEGTLWFGLPNAAPPRFPLVSASRVAQLHASEDSPLSSSSSAPAPVAVRVEKAPRTELISPEEEAELVRLSAREHPRP